MRFIPGIGLGLGAAGLLDDLMSPMPVPGGLEFPGNWVKCYECDWLNPVYGPDNIGWFMVRAGGTSQNCNWNIDLCVAGQAITGIPIGPVPSSIWRHIYITQARETTAGVRHRIEQAWTRTGSSMAGPTLKGPQAVPIPFDGAAPDANLVRKSAPAPEPVPEPAQGPPARWQWNSGGPPLPRPRPHRREPPRRGDKERKMRSQAARIGQALFRALDRISESAEVVDAVYDALPDDVKRRWERGRQSRRFLDQAGQYGIDGADWKLEALYHNWHRVDISQAMKNILQNHVEDKIIGGAQRYLPNNVINAFDREFPAGRSISPEMAISDWVNDLFGG